MSERPTGCVLPAGEAELDAELDRRVETGALTVDDADTVRTFAEFLSKAGPPAPHEATPDSDEWKAWRRSLTDEQVAFRRHTLVDPGWRRFLGLDPAPPA